LTLLCQPEGQVPDSVIGDLVQRYWAMDSRAPLVVFRTRWALSVLAAARDPDRPTLRDLVHALTCHVLDAGDGYAARDILTDERCAATLTEGQRRELADVVGVSGIGQPLPESLLGRLEQALAISEAVIGHRVPVATA
jgi:hypothetical protein